MDPGLADVTLRRSDHSEQYYEQQNQLPEHASIDQRLFALQIMSLRDWNHFLGVVSLSAAPRLQIIILENFLVPLSAAVFETRVNLIAEELSII